MSGSSRYFKQTPCTNCGLCGHHFRNCTAPIYSYGIVAVRVPDSTWNQATQLCMSDNFLNGFQHESLEYLLIQRRDSIGFIELIRAKYKVNDIPYIQLQIEGTTAKEREALKSKSFEELWINLWGESTFETKQYRQEFDQAKQKFEQLRYGVEVNGVVIRLDTLLETTPIKWDTPEWGFPKGRRNSGETDIACAMREFQEETGLTKQDYVIFDGIDPIHETFFGNNTIHYCHVYYLAFVPEKHNLHPETLNEIGGFGWFSLKDALDKIRHTNVEKKELLLRASTVFKNTSLLLISTQVPEKKSGGLPLDYRKLKLQTSQAQKADD